MARQFVFRLETMLRIRRQREDEHKRIVADRLRQIREVQDELARLERQIHDEVHAITDAQRPGTIDMTQVQRHRHWLGRLHKAVLDNQARQRGLEAQLAQDRSALAEAAKRRRILEKLRERQQQQFQKELDRQETRAADDLTTVRYVYNAQATT